MHSNETFLARRKCADVMNVVQVAVYFAVYQLESEIASIKTSCKIVWSVITGDIKSRADPNCFLGKTVLQLPGVALRGLIGCHTISNWLGGHLLRFLSITLVSKRKPFAKQSSIDTWATLAFKLQLGTVHQNAIRKNYVNPSLLHQTRIRTTPDRGTTYAGNYAPIGTNCHPSADVWDSTNFSVAKCGTLAS